MASSTSTPKTRRQIPTYTNFGERLEYMKNWVKLVENGIDFGTGALYIISDRGLLWRNFVTKTEKYISYRSIIGYRIVQNTFIRGFLEISANGLFVSTRYHNGVDNEFDDDEVINFAKNDAAVSSDFLEEFMKPRTDLVIQLHLQNECDLRELMWFTQQFWRRYRQARIKTPTPDELASPGQFDDAIVRRPLGRGRRRHHISASKDTAPTSTASEQSESPAGNLENLDPHKERRMAMLSGRHWYYSPPTAVNDIRSGFPWGKRNGQVGIIWFIQYLNLYPKFWWGPKRVDERNFVKPEQFTDARCDRHWA